MQGLSVWLPGLGGFAIGAAAGFAVRHARLCSFGAIEDALMGRDSRRLRIFGLALGIAILGTQSLIVTGLLRPGLTSFVLPDVPLAAILLGSIMFGIGMAMVTLIESTVSVTRRQSDSAPIATEVAMALRSWEQARGAKRLSKPAAPGDRIMV